MVVYFRNSKIGSGQCDQEKQLLKAQERFKNHVNKMTKNFNIGSQQLRFHQHVFLSKVRDA